MFSSGFKHMIWSGYNNLFIIKVFIGNQSRNKSELPKRGNGKWLTQTLFDCGSFGCWITCFVKVHICCFYTETWLLFENLRVKKLSYFYTVCMAKYGGLSTFHIFLFAENLYMVYHNKVSAMSSSSNDNFFPCKSKVEDEVVVQNPLGACVTC